MRPDAIASDEDVGGAGPGSRVVELVSIHSRGVAVFSIGPDHQGVAIKGYALPEGIIITCVGSLEISLLKPGAIQVAEEDVDGAGMGS